MQPPTNARPMLWLLLAGAAALGACHPASAAADMKPVDVSLFVMSKCSDALYCESYLAPLLDELKYSINLNFHFIGEKAADGSWSCKHGQEECDGNLHQLCVQSYSRDYNRVNWLLHFILCENREPDDIGKFSTAAKCLKEVGAPVVEGTQMIACMYSPGRQAVLESDFAQTAALGVGTSCTIQFEGNTVCVRDMGAWKDCPGGSSLDELKEMLCATIAAKNKGRMPDACQGVGPGGVRVAVA